LQAIYGCFAGRKSYEFLDAILSQIALRQMENDYKHAHVRLNQFVRTFKQPSPAMLIEYFLRASGIATREMQPVADLISPIMFKEDSTPITSNDVSLLAVDAKLREKYLSFAEKRDWLNNIDKFTFLGENSKHPILGILCELGEANGGKGELVVIRRTSSDPGPPAKKQKSESDGRKPSTQFAIKYGFFSRRLSIEDLLEDRNAKLAFKALLETRFDPSEMANVEESHKEVIKGVFRTQPYMQGNASLYT
jgi:hypothetical protein